MKKEIDIEKILGKVRLINQNKKPKTFTLRPDTIKKFEKMAKDNQTSASELLQLILTEIGF